MFSKQIKPINFISIVPKWLQKKSFKTPYKLTTYSKKKKNINQICNKKFSYKIFLQIKKKFNLRINALQLSVGFCHTMQISHNYKYTLPLQPPSQPQINPSRQLQSARLSFLCYTAASHQLSVLHVSVYMSMLLSQSSHPLQIPLCP